MHPCTRAATTVAATIACAFAAAAGAAGTPTPSGKAPPVAPSSVAGAVSAGKVDATIATRIAADKPSEAIVTVRYADALPKNQGTASPRTLSAKAAIFDRRKDAVLAATGVDQLRTYGALPIVAVKINSPSELQRLATSPDVVSVQPNARNTTSLAQSLPLIRQPQVAAANHKGAGTAVAVIDTGVDYRRSAFGSCSAPGTAGCSVAYAQDFAADDGSPDAASDHHGTNVGGIVHGVAPSTQILALDVFGDDGAYDEDILAAINWTIEHQATYNVKAMNLSLGQDDRYTAACSTSSYSAPFAMARLAGILPVVAAGNRAYVNGSYADGVSSPSCADGAVPVGAVFDDDIGGIGFNGDTPYACTDESTSADQITCFSQSGRLIALLAPGSSITAADVTESGTSQATPHVAGAAAVLGEVNPSASAAKILSALKASGPAITDGRNNVTRHRLDLPDAVAAVQRPDAVVRDPACATNQLPANDDGSTAAIPLPFVVDFFGTQYGEAYVNNNGNITFNQSMGTFTPFSITATVPPMIAPFFADVDTRAIGSSLVTWGTTTFGGRPALCVDWVDVGYYTGHADKTNSFQLLLVDHSNVGAGDFDIIMNYDRADWETGDASSGVAGFGGIPAGAGYSAGDGDAAHFYQFPGSLTQGGLLDSNDQGLTSGSRGSQQPGRYVFPIRNGLAPGNALLEGNVTGPGATPLADAPVQACQSGGQCVTTRTGPSGHYSLSALPPGTYDVRAFPPAGSSLIAPQAQTVQLVDAATTTANFQLTGPTGPPAGTTITNLGTTGDGVPVLNWHDQLTLATTACAGGSVSYTIVLGTTTLRSGSMAEGPTGHYTASIAPLYPNTGNAVTTITSTCPNPADDHVTQFDIYIDPSGRVVDQHGRPSAGATVTLLRSDVADGPFVAVEDGSAVMSPANRHNPDTSGADGTFGWDVIAGYYRVQATKAGCTPGQSEVLTIPPPATDLTVTLDCPYHAVSVARAGTGSGTVTSAPAGIDCGATCRLELPQGETVTLQAAPRSGSTFTGWGGVCTGTAPTCTVTLTEDRSVTATFTAPHGDPPPAPHDNGQAPVTGTGGEPSHKAIRCVVPKLAGKTLTAARKALKKAKCRAGKTTRVSSRKVRSGRVVRSGRKAGASLPTNTKVSLVVSRGHPHKR
jgi:uncharacterized repeat protein (TIGR02543 family)